MTALFFVPQTGVGSSLIAALKNGRRAYGTDLESKYVEIGKDRIQKLADGTLVTRPIYQTIWVPKPTDKVAQIPDEWRKP